MKRALSRLLGAIGTPRIRLLHDHGVDVGGVQRRRDPVIEQRAVGEEALHRGSGRPPAIGVEPGRHHIMVLHHRLGGARPDGVQAPEAVAEIITWDRHLSADEMAEAHQYLVEMLSNGNRAPAAAPAPPQPRGHRSQADLDAMAAAHPMGRIGEPEDMAETTLFLLEDDASFITGQDIRVNGGGMMI